MATLLYSYPNKLFALYSNPGWSILPNNYKNDWDFNNPSSAMNFNIAASVDPSLANMLTTDFKKMHSLKFNTIYIIWNFQASW